MRLRSFARVPKVKLGRTPATLTYNRTLVTEIPDTSRVAPHVGWIAELISADSDASRLALAA
jgi:hypothetical protein